jgi:hypothetical protein
MKVNEMINFGEDIGLSLTTEVAAKIIAITTYRYYTDKEEGKGYSVHISSASTGPNSVSHYSTNKNLTIGEADALRLMCQRKVENARRRMRDCNSLLNLGLVG